MLKLCGLCCKKDCPDDYVSATGKSYSLEEFVNAAFGTMGLDYHDYVIIDSKFIRPTDIYCGKANPEKAYKELGWRAKYKMKDVVRFMIDAEKNRI